MSNVRNILITGGLGFIGSAIAAKLIKSGFGVVIVDFDSSSKPIYNKLLKLAKGERVTSAVVLHQFDLCNYNNYYKLDKYNFEAVIHCAAYKSIAMSIDEPMNFYHNNVASTVCLLKYCEERGIRRILFSSTAAVYNPELWYCYEDERDSYAESGAGSGTKNSDPYSGSKLICEQLFLEFNKRCNGESTIFRYFNPIGSYDNIRTDISDSMFGNGFRAVEQHSTFHIFGDCYPTIDGTCLRDYVDLRDIVDAHIEVLEKGFKKVAEPPIYNLGTNRRLSVLDCCKIIKDFVPEFEWDVIEPRQGDGVAGIANCDKIFRDYGWKSKYTVEDTVEEYLKHKS